jgi:hypothetical protein
MQKLQLEALNQANSEFRKVTGPDLALEGRIASFELAFRMQSEMPRVQDLSNESKATLAMYGIDNPVTENFGRQCLLARRFLENGVRYVQVSHSDAFVQWDQHGDLPRDLAAQCKDVDQGCYGLIQDLKQRGMLEDTLVIWGGEFGRTVYSQGTLTETNYGRDHHPRCFSIWMAGGGIKGGQVYGETDDMSYNIADKTKAVHIRDLHATILHALGIDHERMTYKFQGLDQRLTGVEPAKVIKDLFA